MAKKSYIPIFRGMNLKKEAGLLEEGEVASCLNVTSPQEGVLAPRQGTLNYTPSLGLTGAHSMAKMNLGSSVADASNPRYVGDGTAIKRITGPYSSATDVTAGLSFWALGSGRWEAQPFNAGSQGNPSIYFAHPTRNLYDDGSFATLRQWGINPIIRPVRLGLGLGSSGIQALFVSNSSTGHIVNTTVSSATAIIGQYFDITPASMAGISAGMSVYINGNKVIVDSATTTTFRAYYPSGTPSGTIVTDYFGGIIYTDDGTIQTGTVTGVTAADWSFAGLASTGYSTADPVCFYIGTDGWYSITGLKIRILVGGSSYDWYEYAIPLDSLSPSAGILGGRVFQIPKNQFTPQGLAGSGIYSWKSVTGVMIEVSTLAAGGTSFFTVNVGSVYAAGGNGPNSIATSTSLPYRYVVTARNPVTGEEGNPSQPLIDSNAIVSGGRPILVECPGSDKTVATGNPSLDGQGSLVIYRAGGTFADGLYRRVGMIVNPGTSGGVPLTSTFVDEFSDVDIDGNPIAHFDNWPPVPCNLKVPFNAVLAAPIAAGAAILVTPSGWTGAALNTFLTQGSQITIGNEVMTLAGVNATQIAVWPQYAHAAGETITCNFVVGSPADVVCLAGDSILLAGNIQSPNVVFRSKASGPAQWPVINESTGLAHSQIISSPSDPINGLVDWGGTYVALCRDSIYTFQLWQGLFSNVNRTAADHGMVNKHLWCKVGTMIWYLSYDGIYAWQGAECVKVTEDIDPIFQGPAVNAYPQVDWTRSAEFSIRIFNNKVWFFYIDSNSAFQVLRYDLIYKRWEPMTFYATGGTGQILNALEEFDVRRLTLAIKNSATSAVNLARCESGDTTDSTAAIIWSAFLGYYYPGGRSVENLLQDVLIEIQNPASSVQVKMYYDYSITPDAVDTFTITSNPDRRFVPLPLQQVGGKTLGKAARVVLIEITSASAGPTRVFSLEFNYEPIAEIQRGRATDWDDLGYPFDKQLYEMTIEYISTTTVTLNMDALGGKDGATVTTGAAVFTLPAAARAEVTLPIPVGVIAKKIRLIPNASATDFRIVKMQCTQFEKYPPDVVAFTEYQDKGDPFEKYWQQIILDVNTNGQNVSLIPECDGVAHPAITVNSTLATRDQTFVLDPIIKGRKMRLRVNTGTLPASGMFQLFSHDYVALPADRGAVEHSFDWDTLGSPYDKRLLDISFEYDFSGLGPITFVMDIIYGPDGTTQSLAVQSFVLSGSGRSVQTFAINIDTIVKAIRIHPTTTLRQMKTWKYVVSKIDYPPDRIPATEWDIIGWGCDKILRGITITIDTGGVACSLQLQVDGVNQGSPIVVTTTSNDKTRILTVPSDIIGREFRIVPTPGSGGKAQIFNVEYDVIREPCARSRFDSYELSFGTQSWKFIKQMWIDYTGAGALTVSVYVEDDILFYSKVLPIHAHRDVERFFLPDAVSSVYNKSRKYRIVITSPSVFKLYLETSRIEWLDMSGDRRASYQQFHLSESTQPATV